MPQLTVDKAIEDSQEFTATLKFLKKKFGDSLVIRSFPNNNIVFCSKKVNQSYTGYDFITERNGVSIIPYCLNNFKYKGKDITVRVDCLPRVNRLLYLWRQWDPKAGSVIKTHIQFTKLTVNVKNRDMKEDFLNDCRMQIMKVIQETPNAQLHLEHLDPRLKKLLSFI